MTTCRSPRHVILSSSSWQSEADHESRAGRVIGASMDSCRLVEWMRFDGGTNWTAEEGPRRVRCTAAHIESTLEYRTCDAPTVAGRP